MEKKTLVESAERFFEEDMDYDPSQAPIEKTKFTYYEVELLNKGSSEAILTVIADTEEEAETKAREILSGTGDWEVFEGSAKQVDMLTSRYKN